MEEIKKEKEYNAVQVPVQYAPAIETPSGEILTVETALALILNKLTRIEKLLG